MTQSSGKLWRRGAAVVVAATLAAVAPARPATRSPQGEVRVQACQAVPQPESYVSLVLRMTDKGKIDVVKSSVLTGKLIQRDVPDGDFIYEVTSNDKTTYTVASLGQDPLLMRGFSDPAAGGGESVGRAKSATVVLHIPVLSRADVCTLGIRFYQVKSGESPGELSPATLERLKSQRRLVLQFELTREKLGSAICRK